MHKKFEINRTKIPVGCQSRRKVVAHNSKSDLPLAALTTAVSPLVKVNNARRLKRASTMYSADAGSIKKFAAYHTLQLRTLKVKEFHKSIINVNQNWNTYRVFHSSIVSIP